MDCLQSCPRWAKWTMLFIVLGVGITYAVLLQSKMPALLGLARTVKQRRDEVDVILGVFGAAMFSAPLAIIPSGTIMVAGALSGYIYGFAGLGLAWPGLSIGLAIVFTVARLASSRGSQQQPKEGEVRISEADAAHSSLPSCLQGRHTRAFIRGILRLLKEQPKRTAILMTFASHAPLTQFIFGWATDLRWTDAILACGLDGIKIIPALLKGMAIGDVLEIITSSDAHRTCWNDGTHCVGLILKVCVSLAIGIVFLLMARAVMREIHEMDEEEDGPEQPLFGSDNESVNEGAGTANEMIGEYGATKP